MINFEGIIIGLAAFLMIGVFHPIVIKAEYYFGVRCWPAFLLVGIAGCVASVLGTNTYASVLLGIFSFSCFWSILELFEQRERVRKGWFPKNPNRGAKSISRTRSFIIITCVYLAATIVGIVVYHYARTVMSALAALFIADFAATVFTWAWGLIYKNVSVYDPYWSVAPPVLLTIYASASHAMTIPTLVMLLVITVWAVRLTINWAVTFKGMHHEDWRYTKFRETLHPVLFQLVNFFGLNLMPTIVVFLAMTPAIRLIDAQPQASVYTWLGATMCLAAALIQHLADTTAHRFRNEHPGQICRVGLWKHGRHPNYFGEILMWWGVWVQSLSLPMDWTISGAIVNTLMFLCISIPLMEARQMKNKPDYASYRKETRILI